MTFTLLAQLLLVPLQVSSPLPVFLTLSPFICHLVRIKGPKQKKEGPLVSAAKPKVLFYLSLPLKFETNNPTHLWSGKKKVEWKHTEQTRDRIFVSYRSTRRASGASDEQIPANATKIQAESHISTTFCHTRLCEPLNIPQISSRKVPPLERVFPLARIDGTYGKQPGSR